MYVSFWRVCLQRPFDVLQMGLALEIPDLVVLECTFNSPAKRLSTIGIWVKVTNNKAELVCGTRCDDSCLRKKGIDTQYTCRGLYRQSVRRWYSHQKIGKQKPTRTLYFHFEQPLKSGMTSLFVGWLDMLISQRMMRQTDWRTSPLQKAEPNRVDLALDSVCWFCR